MERKIS